MKVVLEFNMEVGMHKNRITFRASKEAVAIETVFSRYIILTAVTLLAIVGNACAQQPRGRIEEHQ